MPPSVARVLADGLARAGTRRLYAAPSAPPRLGEAAGAAGLAVVEARSPAGACRLAAVDGDLGEAPGAAALPLAAPPGPLADGLAQAARDRLPLLVLAGRAAGAPALGPAVKASLEVEAASAGHWVAHGARLAMSEPRGPVLLAVAADVLAAPAVPVAAPCRLEPPPPPAPAALDAVAAALARAARPVVLTGAGCRADDAAWVRAFAESLPAPVVATLRGKGAIPDPHPLALGLATAGHPALAASDLVVAVGVEEPERPSVGWVPGVPLVRLARAAGADAVAAEAVGDLALILAELAPRLRGRPAADWDVAALDRIKRARAGRPPGAALTAAEVVRLARELTPAGTVAAADAAVADPAVAEAWHAVAPREFLVAEGAAGWALGAALAAALALPDRGAVAFTDAPGLAAAEEPETLARLGLPVVVVLLDDGRVPLPAPGAGLPVAAADGATAFRRAFDAAWRTGAPALVVARVVR